MRRAHIHHLRIPSIGYRLWHAGVLLAAIVGTVVFAEFEIHPRLKRITRAHGFSPIGRMPLYSITSLVIGLSVGVPIVRRVRHQAYHRPHNRMNRLNHIAGLAGSASRAPHRLLERAIRVKLWRGARPRVLLGTVEPGHVVVVNGPPSHWVARSRAFRSAFELVELAGHDKRILDLFEEHDKALSEQGSSTSEKSARGRGAIVIKWAVRLGPAAIATAYVLWKMASDSTWRILGIAYVGLLFIGSLAYRLDIRRRWWIAPGVLATRLAVPGKHVSIEMARPDTSPLVIFPGAGVALVRLNGHVYSIRRDFTLMCALLVAWVSEAPQPTREQIELLLADRPGSKGSPNGTGRVRPHEQT